MNGFKNVLHILSRLLLIVFFVFAIFLSLFIPLGLLLFTISEAGIEFSQEIEFFLNMISQNLAVILAVIIVYRIFYSIEQFSLGWKEDNFFKKGIEGSLWGIFMITVPFVLVFLLGGIRVNSLSLNIEVLKNLATGLIIFLMVAISEELLVRGYIQGLLKKYYGIKVAIVVGSLLFSLLHIFNENILQNPIPLLVLFLAGIFFGISREVTGGLWVPIGIHFTWNFFQGHIYGFEVSGIDIGSTVFEIERRGHQLISGGDFGLEGSLITVIFLIAVIFLHYWYYKGRKNNMN